MRLFLFAVAVLSLLCCNKTEKDHCTPERFHYQFQTNKKIDTVHRPHSWSAGTMVYYQIHPGSQIVFKYSHVFRDCPEIADEEGAKDVVFQIPASVTRFRADDATELSDLKVGVHFSCYGCNGFSFLTDGFIEGTKKSENTWHIKASLFLPTRSIPVSFEADFIKTN